MIEDHDIGAVGGIGRGIGIVGHGIDIPAVVGIYLGKAKCFVVLALQPAQLVVEVAVSLAEHVGVFGDALVLVVGKFLGRPKGVFGGVCATLEMLR